MAVFKDVEQLYECIGELMARGQVHETVGPKIGKSKQIIRFKYTNPDSQITIDATGSPSKPGTHFDLILGDCDLKPDIMLSSTADVAHRFWHGKINLIKALTKREVSLKGSKTKVIRLLPAITPMFKVYPIVLKDKGYNHLIIKK